MTPPEGITIGETYVPGDVTISTPFYTVGRRKFEVFYLLIMMNWELMRVVDSCFKNASEFIPERWGEKPELVIDKSVFLPFSTG